MVELREKALDPSSGGGRLPILEARLPPPPAHVLLLFHGVEPPTRPPAQALCARSLLGRVFLLKRSCRQVSLEWRCASLCPGLPDFITSNEPI